MLGDAFPIDDNLDAVEEACSGAPIIRVPEVHLETGYTSSVGHVSEPTTLNDVSVEHVLFPVLRELVSDVACACDRKRDTRERGVAGDRSRDDTVSRDIQAVDIPDLRLRGTDRLAVIGHPHADGALEMQRRTRCERHRIAPQRLADHLRCTLDGLT